MKIKKKKAFDCVDMQDAAALRIHVDTKEMSMAEELAYWRRQAAEGAKELRNEADATNNQSTQK